jgi:aryl-alcohol dehydrogenase-like predicted oxidoreductase
MVKPAWPGCISIGGDRAAREWYAANQMPLFTWSSLAGGFMTGKFRRDNLDTFTEYFDEVTVNAYCYEDNFARLDRAEELAAKKGVTLPQIALAYVLKQSLNTFALVGCLSGQEFADNAAALDVEITADEVAWLEGGV